MPRPVLPTRRALVATTAWSTPLVLVGGAAPAFAASGTSVTATFAVQRTAADQVVESGVVTNHTGAPVTVTIRISADITPGTPGRITNGDLNNDAPWSRDYFYWTDGTGDDPTSAYFQGTTTTALAPGASLATPNVIYYLDAAATTGTARLTLTVPAPATVVQPAPLPIPPFTALAPARIARRTTGAFRKPR
ncbi:hypothetical protein [Phycicoccus flavus]|uniref:hypothetical protein n=1 Tax=Phycicoccus flavus TaxID=2502783 RepID=UPI000FEBFEA5|nr:hypothetical protein [Phycicoccus flavus]NHA66543.1 hypothetical protein [Phycicoccus flavus]